MPSRTICVFCASSNHASTELFQLARRAGLELAARGHTLIYGGGSIGLMGEVARSVHEAGGRVIGVIPERLRKAEVAYEDADELVVTSSMAQRKTVMIERADAFLNLPGSFGTLDELLEVITLRLLGYHDKPIVLVNERDFWGPLLEFFERLYQERLAAGDRRELYHVTADLRSALDWIEAQPRSA